jgi:hypothetical protein
LVRAFAFGSRQLSCPTFNDPSVNYTIVYHGTPQELVYAPWRGWGYEVLYPDPFVSPFGNRNGYEIFGPFDDSPNNRNEFPETCPEELYDSFIGAKNFTAECSAATVGDPNTPCAQGDLPEPQPQGVIFRIDVPNGTYRFVAASGDSDNPTAHRILAEDGGAGLPEDIGRHVVLIHNFNQTQFTIGETQPEESGAGVYARVGFDGRIPPPGDGIPPSPQFVNMDGNGMPTEAAPHSPPLEVTQRYVSIHQHQANANDGPGGSRDPNGGDLTILELWRVDPVSGLFQRGDANADGILTISDVISISRYLFLGGHEPACLDAADVNDDGGIDLSDGVYLCNYEFLEGPPPPPPFWACGVDETTDDLDCRAFDPCS